jgi:biopolymer transport protein ExbD
MAMAVGSPDGDGEEELNSAINTTPLVDVMLVLLIIFLITIPVVTHTVPVKLPSERNQPYKTNPQNINISVNKDGDVFWNQTPVPNSDELLQKLEEASTKEPQPEVHIRGDQSARYESVGKVLLATQRAGIAKVAFVMEPPPNGAR